MNQPLITASLLLLSFRTDSKYSKVLRYRIFFSADIKSKNVIDKSCRGKSNLLSAIGHLPNR